MTGGLVPRVASKLNGCSPPSRLRDRTALHIWTQHRMMATWRFFIGPSSPDCRLLNPDFWAEIKLLSAPDYSIQSDSPRLFVGPSSPDYKILCPYKFMIYEASILIYTAKQKVTESTQSHPRLLVRRKRRRVVQWFIVCWYWAENRGGETGRT